MLHKAGWALGMIFLLTQLAGAQTAEPAEKIPLPVQPGIKMDAPAPDGMPPLPFAPARSPSLFYVDADYLLWWVNHGPAPTLLTTAPNNGLNANGLTGGILGQPGTAVLFTGRDLDYGAFSAVRANVGINLGDGFWALEVGGFYLPKQSFNYTNSGNGTPLLTIPFLDAGTGQQSSLDISALNGKLQPYLSGSITIHSDIEVWGYEVNAIAHSIRTADRTIDLLFGFRSLTLNENLSINQTIIPAQTGNISIQSPTVGLGAKFYDDPLAGTPVYVTDQFGTRNQFYGPQAGGRFHWDRGPWSAELTAKIAVGVTHEEATINGSTTAVQAVNPTTGIVSSNLTTQGGTFALKNNIGSYSQDQFTVVPEIGLNLRYALTSWLHLQIGYSAMYWSNVARPGAQIDSVLNSKLIPTGALVPTVTTPPSPIGSFLPGQEQGRPYFAFRDTAFWAQGINVGVEFRY